MKITVKQIGNDYKVLVNGITVASTDNEGELEALIEYYSRKYEDTDGKRKNKGE